VWRGYDVRATWCVAEIRQEMALAAPYRVREPPRCCHGILVIVCTFHLQEFL
jgi:hypothetical protein